MKIACPKEVSTGEARVAVTPTDVSKYRKLGFEVVIEAGAGAAADFTDDQYREAGAEVNPSARDVYNSADILLKVRAPGPHPTGSHEFDMVRDGTIIISFFFPLGNEAEMEHARRKNLTFFSVNQIPRISIAQSMDALSSMANLAGYRAVIEAANSFGKFMPGQITAAGKVPPAKVLVIGAGVAGLSALGTAKKLGAVTRAFDTRPAVKDQVISMGGEFLEIDMEEDGTGEGGYAKVMSEEFIRKEMELFLAQAKEVDIIITTALIPGKPAPKLITEEMIAAMKDGSVVVDLASEQGGNCELTEPGKVVKKHGVTIIGYTDLPCRLPYQASVLYSANLVHFVKIMNQEGTIKVNLEDVIIRGALITHGSELMYPPPKLEIAQDATAAPSKSVYPKTHQHPKADPETVKKARMQKGIIAAALAVVFIFLAVNAPASFLAHFTVFVLSCFVGYQVIWNVTPALHTPLMSVTNAISGIIIIGAMVQLPHASTFTSKALALAAIFFATINIAGGFLVTQRMLKMFRR